MLLISVILVIYCSTSVPNLQDRWSRQCGGGIRM